MLSISTLLALGATLLRVSNAATLPNLASRQTRYTIQNWSNEFANVDFNNDDGGEFDVDWDNGPGGNFVVGKGYSPGGDMLFNYSGTFQTDGWAYLALYGWTTNPLVEYYVIESMGQHNPSDNASATQYGTLQSDGATYEIWQKRRINAPSIFGTADFDQYWSIRTSMHCGGTINTGNHFRAWQAAGLPLGKQNYMVLAVEGQQGGGSADITVGALPTGPVPETTTSTYRSIKRTSTKRPTTTKFVASSTITSAPRTSTTSRK